MAKFAVYRRASGEGYLLDCQADLLSRLNTRFVVPLMPSDDAPKPAARLNRVFEVQGEPCVMLTQFAAAVLTTELGERVMSLIDRDIDVTNALDMLISGF